MNGSGKGGGNRGNRRQSSKHKDRENPSHNRGGTNSGGKKADLFLVERYEKKRGSLQERPKWVPPKPPAISLPPASCAWCGKPIKDISTAIAEPDSGEPVHFDCVIDRIVERETLESGDTVSYIGGGRFGIVHYNNPPDIRDFTIKKIFEWEIKENRSEWRVKMSDHFSVT
jgi:hypothetical protein